MDSFPLYARMVHASELAIEAIEQQNFGHARQILIDAQQECEEYYLQHSPTQTTPIALDPRKNTAHPANFHRPHCFAAHSENSSAPVGADASVRPKKFQSPPHP